MMQVLSFLPSINPLAMALRLSGCDIIKVMEACTHFRDYDALFNKYEEHYNLQRIGSATGLRVRNQNRLVAKWPLKLKQNASREEFDILLASGHVGSERYVEWERVE